MGKKPSTIAAFEYGPTGLRFAEISRHERRILSAGSFPFEPGRWRDPEHVAAQVRSVLDTTARGKVDGLIASVPLGNAHLRIVETPPETPDAREYIAWDMARYLARPLDLYALDAHPLPGDAGGRRFLASAFRRDEAVRLRDTLETATGVPLTVLDVDAAAIVNAFAASHPEFLSEDAILIQAGQGVSTLLRTRNGNLEDVLVHRILGEEARRPAAEPQERAENLLHCARGIAETLRAGGGKWDVPDRVFLCGELSASADFRELLRVRLPVPFRLLNPFRNIPGPDPVEFPGAYPGAPLSAAVGLALRMTEET